MMGRNQSYKELEENILDRRNRTHNGPEARARLICPKNRKKRLCCWNIENEGKRGRKSVQRKRHI